MASIPILGSPSGGDVPISPGTAHGAWHRWNRVLRLLATLTLFAAAFTESVQASWAYTSGSTGTQSGFTYHAPDTESPTNTAAAILVE